MQRRAAHDRDLARPVLDHAEKHGLKEKIPLRDKDLRLLTKEACGDPFIQRESSRTSRRLR